MLPSSKRMVQEEYSLASAAIDRSGLVLPAMWQGYKNQPPNRPPPSIEIGMLVVDTATNGEENHRDTHWAPGNEPINSSWMPINMRQNGKAIECLLVSRLDDSTFFPCPPSDERQRLMGPTARKAGTEQRWTMHGITISYCKQFEIEFSHFYLNLNSIIDVKSISPSSPRIKAHISFCLTDPSLHSSLCGRMLEFVNFGNEKNITNDRQIPKYWNTGQQIFNFLVIMLIRLINNKFLAASVVLLPLIPVTASLPKMYNWNQRETSNVIRQQLPLLLQF